MILVIIDSYAHESLCIGYLSIQFLCVLTRILLACARSPVIHNTGNYHTSIIECISVEQLRPQPRGLKREYRLRLRDNLLLPIHNNERTGGRYSLSQVGLNIKNKVS